MSGYLIARSAKEQGCEAAITFDKKASKHNLFG
jgi:predicted nucleic-acid-binding protein